MGDVQRHNPVPLARGKTSSTYFTGVGWVPGPVWTDVENLLPTGIRSPDHPAHSESLYRLRHTGPWGKNQCLKFLHEYIQRNIR